MKLTSVNTCIAATLLCSSLLVPAFSQGHSTVRPAQSPTVEVPFFAVVESIEFKDVSREQQKLVLDRIGVRVGDVLSVEVRHRIGRELGQVGKGMTFKYVAGSKPDTAKLIISADC